MLVVGGGYIGLELGYVYAAFGSKVTVVEMTSGLLPGVDRDLVRPLQTRLTTLFDKIHLNTRVVKLEETKKGIRAVLEGTSPKKGSDPLPTGSDPFFGQEVTDKEPIFDRVLIAVGRRPNSQGLGLENTRVEVDEKGFLRSR